MTTFNPARRNYLVATVKTVVAAAAMAASSSDALAAELVTSPEIEKSLKLYNTHTHEFLQVVFCRDGIYDQASLNELNVLLRDHRTNEATEMDRGLFDQMWQLQQRCGGDEVFEIISGYRSPATNNNLLKKSSGVAEKSYHVKGQAIDLRLRGTKLSKLRLAARAMKAGGVGYYPSSDFVHLDTGPVRSWS